MERERGDQEFGRRDAARLSLRALRRLAYRPSSRAGPVMSLRLLCPEPLAPIPRRIVLELRCDGDHGLFPPEPGRFDEDGFIASYSRAMQAGWLDRQDSVLCPEC